MGSGIYLQDFDGRGRALLTSVHVEKEHITYRHEATQSIQNDGFEYQEVIQMGPGEIADRFMSYESWCSMLEQTSDEEQYATVIAATREILGEENTVVKNRYDPNQVDTCTMPDGFLVLATDKSGHLCVGTRGYEHSQVFGVFLSTAIAQDVYYTGYDKQQYMYEHASKRVLDTGLSVDIIQEYEQAKIESLFNNIRARLQESIGHEAVYKASGGYLASFFERPEDYNTYAQEMKSKYEAALQLERSSFERSKTLNTEQASQVCAEQINFHSIQKITQVAYIDVESSQAIFMPFDKLSHGLNPGDSEQMLRVGLPEGWQDWEGVSTAYRAYPEDTIIEMPSNGQALEWVLSRNAEALKNYNEGKDVPNNERYAYPRGILEAAGKLLGFDAGIHNSSLNAGLLHLNKMGKDIYPATLLPKF